MAPGDRVVRRHTKDRALFIVIQGQYFGLDDSYPSNREIFKTGAIIGADQFMKDDYWDIDLICKEEGSIIAKFDYKSFQDLKESQPGSAIKIYNRIVRHMSFELLYKKKNDPEYFGLRMMEIYSDLKLKDEDLFIDLRLGNPKEITNLFIANKANINIKTAMEQQKKQAENPSASGKPNFALSKDPNLIIGAKKDVNFNLEDAHLPGHGLHSVDGPHFDGLNDIPSGVNNKADLVETIPLFLSDHYKQIYLASAQAKNSYSGITSPSSSKQADKKKDEKKEVKKGAAKVYRSAWVLGKLNDQIDKKKKSRG